MVRAGVREPALEGLVHDVDAQLSPGALHVLHPGSCGGDGAAGSVRSPSCARCARPAFAIFSRTPRVFLQACKEPSWGQSQGAWSMDGRAADESVLGIRLRMAAEADLASRGRRRGEWGRGGGVPLLLEITLRADCARRAGKHFDTPTGTIRAYLNTFQ